MIKNIVIYSSNGLSLLKKNKSDLCPRPSGEAGSEKTKRGRVSVRSPGAGDCACAQIWTAPSAGKDKQFARVGLSALVGLQPKRGEQKEGEPGERGVKRKKDRTIWRHLWKIIDLCGSLCKGI